MNSWGHQLICHSWEESSSTLVLNVHSRSAWNTDMEVCVWHGSTHTRPEYRGDRFYRRCSELHTAQIHTPHAHAYTQRSKDKPPSTQAYTHSLTHTSHDCFALPGRLLPRLSMSELIGRLCSSPVELTSWIGRLCKGSFSGCFPISSRTNRWISHYFQYHHTLLILFN